MRRRENRKPAGAGSDEPGCEHSAEHQDPRSMIEDHLIVGPKAAATAGWYPSRRGVSPRGTDPKSKNATRTP
jgi:hypothetical protein